MNDQRFSDAVETVRNDVAHRLADAARGRSKEDKDRLLVLYEALIAAYPDICSDPNLMPEQSRRERIRS